MKTEKLGWLVSVAFDVGAGATVRRSSGHYAYLVDPIHTDGQHNSSIHLHNQICPCCDAFLGNTSYTYQIFDHCSFKVYCWLSKYLIRLFGWYTYKYKCAEPRHLRIRKRITVCDNCQCILLALQKKCRRLIIKTIITHCQPG